MHRLKQAYRGRRAVVVLGGASLVERRTDLGVLRNKDAVVFLESKALTPYFLSFGVTPDYYLMLFPEKCVCNALQNFAFRGLLARVNIRPGVKRRYALVVDHLVEHREDYLEPWRLHRGPHKRYRWKPGVFLPGSPLDLLTKIPDTRVIANGPLLDAYFPSGWPFPNPVHRFRQDGKTEAFSPERYYAPNQEHGDVVVTGCGFLNSAAIGLYPLLEFMGFDEVYFLGMDMTMLGSFEYAAPYTFKSMLHFRWYFWRTRPVFNAAYQPNTPFFFRPRSEFEDAKLTLRHGRTKWIRVYDPSPYAALLEGIPTVGWKEFARS